MKTFGHGLTAVDSRRETLYIPEKRPGFVAWATAFDYGDGRFGLSFKETLFAPKPGYIPARLEMGEAVGAPVSYCSVECDDAQQYSFRVYMMSSDNGRTFTETGRCQLDQGSFCNVGFPDGRIIGMDVPRINEARTGWCDYIEVRESTDGGHSWTPVTRLLEGCAPYLWRSRRLSDGTIILLASLYGTPWGLGKERTTRNTMLPGETYIHKIQTFFMTSRDGRSFDGPHYILPGIGAHEYDVAECPDGRLLFIAGDVQGTPVARQFVQRRDGGYINGTLYSIRRGAPQDPARNTQGGFIPESLVMLPDGLLVGSRRGKPYSCSNDYGENWYELDGVEPSLYQPFLLLLPDGTIANFGHYGGDAAVGQHDMWLGADFFRVDNRLPAACTLSLARQLSGDNSHYTNEYTAVLRVGSRPVAGEKLTFRFAPVWNPDGSYGSQSQDEAPIQINAETDAEGRAFVHAAMFDNYPDIHYYYNVDVIFRPEHGSRYSPCDGPLMVEAALTPHRCCRYPHAAYFAEGTLFLSPQLEERFPKLAESLEPFTGEEGLPPSRLPEELRRALLECGILQSKDGQIAWLPSVHAPYPLKDIKPMGGGDWYV
jgi:hypothetical protein